MYENGQDFCPFSEREAEFLKVDGTKDPFCANSPIVLSVLHAARSTEQQDFAQLEIEA